MAAPRSFGADDIEGLLANDDDALWEDVFAAAREVKRRYGKEAVLPRGLIETSNVCGKDCLYCGIRKSNSRISRYKLTEAAVHQCCDEARRRGYPAIALQAGELEGEENTLFYERILAKCHDLEVTLSLGEQTESVYRRWKEAGALRYLLRIETSNRELYEKLHPASCSFTRRLECIRTLKKLGYVTGTGVMIGLPGQTLRDLANDIVFFGDEGVDMVGMGPYVPNPDTPLANRICPTARRRLESALKMIAIARLYLHDINIVAATALSALDNESGSKRGIAAGANVIMPDLTPSEYKANYDLYPGKAVAN